jgi:hypothetical protein
MPDPIGSPNSSPGELLAFQALLYAGGELDGEEAREFETRLASDQAAREALCQAVQVSSALGGVTATRPSPAWRAQARRRLLPARLRSGLFAPRSYRGHPAFWSGLGAAAAVLLMLGLGRGPAASPPAAQPAPEQSALTATAPPRFAPTPEEARAWANLHKNEQFVKAEERLRLARKEDVRARLIANPMTKQ